jgi:uncharacterized protein with HEPN domain
MPADDLMYIGHMLDMARQAVSKVRGKTRKEFDEDDNLRLALAYLLQSIGEAARRVSQPFQSAHPAILWKAIVRIGDVARLSRILLDSMQSWA